MTDFMIVRVDDGDLVRLLEHLHADIGNEDEGNAAGPTLIAWRRISLPHERRVAMLLHDFGGLRLQDWIAGSRQRAGTDRSLHPAAKITDSP
jgi:hypothetical protein